MSHDVDGSERTTENVGLLPLSQRKGPDVVSSTADDSEIADFPKHSYSTAPAGSGTALHGVLHGLGLKIVRSLARKKKPEEPKVAYWRKRRVAIPRLIVHFIPVSICIVLLYLYFRGFYVGDRIDGVLGEEGVEENTLQFASKIHELTMLASLTVAVFTEARRRLMSSKAPFAILFAGGDFQQVSYLWSKELWAIAGPTAKSWSGALFLLSLVTATVLAPFIGPASALLMIPKLSDWEVGGTDFWINATREQLWPVQFDRSQIDANCLANSEDLSCPHGGWEALRTVIGVRHSDEFQIRTKNGVSTMWIGDRALSSVQQASIGDALLTAGMDWDDMSVRGSIVGGKHYRWRNSSRWEVNDVQQPYSRPYCYQNTVKADGEGLTKIDFPYGSLMKNETVLDDVRERLKAPEPSLLWIGLDSLDRTVNGSTGGIAIFPAPSPGGLGSIISCLVTSRWINTTYHITNDRRHGPQVYPLATDNNYDEFTNDEFLATFPLIRISKSWADYLNPGTYGTNVTVFDRLLQSVHLNSNSSWDDKALFVHDIFSSLVTHGLSKAAYSATLQGKLRADNDTQLRPQNGAVFGGGGEAYDIDGLDTSKMTKFTMNAIINGKGYGNRSKTYNFSATMLLLYCALALGHTIFTLYTGVCYMGWESQSELSTLAIQSSMSEHLSNTGAGIDSMAIYKIPVAIRDFDGKLKLAFDDTSAGGQPARPNVAYS
ncbi:hypothetical protein FQN53_003850 [Emmonsiellopsis sp. PD_33]|nr:hypothetical protein FQN53_003850 [Emmonsiellopsis sp. PD_33]